MCFAWRLSENQSRLLSGLGLRLVRPGPEPSPTDPYPQERRHGKVFVGVPNF